MIKILVIGESCRDVFNYGECNRLCPEAPVPIFNPSESIENAGMAMNVQNNIVSLGVKCDLVTNDNWQDIKKIRHIDQRTNHMFIRIDENDNDYGRCNLNNISWSEYDAVVISDYNKGFLTESDIRTITDNHECVFMDTKRTLGPWANKVHYIKVNHSEYLKTKRFLTKTLENKLIITLGSQGSKHQDTIYSVPRVEIKDTSGAGDTFVSGLVVKYVQTMDIKKSIIYANKCATKVVQKRGVDII